MHYMNGRPASNGDVIVLTKFWSSGKQVPVVGVLYNATAGNNTCNGSLAPVSGGPHTCPNLAECLHIDDYLSAQPAEYPDTSKT